MENMLLCAKYWPIYRQVDNSQFLPFSYITANQVCYILFLIHHVHVSSKAVFKSRIIQYNNILFFLVSAPSCSLYYRYRYSLCTIDCLVLSGSFVVRKSASFHSVHVVLYSYQWLVAVRTYYLTPLVTVSISKIKWNLFPLGENIFPFPFQNFLSAFSTVNEALS